MVNQDMFFDNILKLMQQAHSVCEKRGFVYDFKCPICGGKAHAGRALYNGNKNSITLNRQKGGQYGKREWDEEYIKWVFKDEASQIDFTQKLLKIFPKQAKSILDVACGIGRYHKVCLENGYSVTGTDLSNFFIEHAQKINPMANYYVCDAQVLPTEIKYDIVTASEPGIMNAYIIRNIYKCLNPNGLFILESRNPNHPRSRDFRSENRTWIYENGIFKLFRREFNFISQIYEMALSHNLCKLQINVKNQSIRWAGCRNTAFRLDCILAENRRRVKGGGVRSS